MRWKTLSTEYLFKDTWFTVRKDRCETEDGRIIDPYYVYEFPTWATACALTEDNNVILVRQYRHALDQISLETPGGCVDDTDADPQAGIARELMEETGYEFSSFTYLGKTSPNPSTNNNWMHMYLAKGGKKVADQNLDHNEEIEVELYSIEEVKAMLDKNEIIQAMHCVCLFKAFRELGVISW